MNHRNRNPVFNPNPEPAPELMPTGLPVVVAESVGGSGNSIGTGSRVSGIELGDEEGRLIYDPNHPLADDEGMVRGPDMDLETQMTHLIVAQRSYQANVTVFERARDSYQRALEIGR